MRVGVTGAGGLVGSTLVPLWREAGADVEAWTRQDLDITDERAVGAVIGGHPLDVVVHCAAWTDVDGAEAHPDAAMRVNGRGTSCVAAAARAAGAVLVYLSTDYVFGGTGSVPLDPATPTGPLGAYGRSKAAGEAAVRETGDAWLIVRTGWLYGPGGRNFVDTMMQAARAGRAVRVVNDQWGAPTSARLVSDVMRALVASRARGVWHVAASGWGTWHDVARAVYEDAGADPSLVAPIASSALGRPAPRPAFAVLACDATVRAVGAPLPDWREQLRSYVRDGVLADSGIGRVAA